MQQEKHPAIIALGFFSALALITVSCKGKTKTLPNSTPTPAPTSTPLSTPAPGPSPVYAPGTCLPELPAGAVRLVHPAACPTGYRRVNYEGTAMCVAISACPKTDKCQVGEAPEIIMECKNWGGDGFADNIRWRHWTLDMNKGMFFDDGRGWYDALGRRTWDGEGSQNWTPWGFTGSCPPKLCLTKQSPSCRFRTPPLNRLDVEVVGTNGLTRTVQVTPIVCNGNPGSGLENYCNGIPGASGGCCPVRGEGDPDLEICEKDLIGTNPYKNNEFSYQFEYWAGDARQDTHDMHIFYVTPPAAAGMTFRVCSNPYAPNARPAVTCVTRDFNP